MARKVELMHIPLLPADATFTESELQTRGNKAYRDLLLMYPALLTTKQYKIGRRFQSKSGSICLVVELEESPQGRLRYTDGRNSITEDSPQLEAIAQMILSSARDGQDRIYLQAQNINCDPLAFSGKASQEDRSLNALLSQRRNTQISIDTLLGQDHFDFPDVVEFTIIDPPVSLTGLVEWVGGTKFRLFAIRFVEKPDIHYARLAYQHRKDVYFQTTTQDVRALGQAVLVAAIDLTRVRIKVHVAVRPLTGNVDYFVLHDSTIEVIG